MKVTFDTVRQIGLALPDVEESTSYGAFSLKVRGKMFACTAINRAAEPGTLAVRLAFHDRDELIEADPDVYYLKDHYKPYPCVLVRLSRIRRDALADLLLAAHRFMSAQTKPKSRRR